MKQPLTIFLRVMGCFFVLIAIAGLILELPLWMVIGCAVIACFFLIKSIMHPSLDEVRGSQPAATIFNPMTATPDFDGYRPQERDLPQNQPAAEMIEKEVSGEVVTGFDHLTLEQKK